MSGKVFRALGAEAAAAAESVVVRRAPPVKIGRPEGKRRAFQSGRRLGRSVLRIAEHASAQGSAQHDQSRPPLCERRGGLEARRPARCCAKSFSAVHTLP